VQLKSFTMKILICVSTSCCFSDEAAGRRESKVSRTSDLLLHLEYLAHWIISLKCTPATRAP